MTRTIRTHTAPAPKGPYEQGVVAGGLLVITAQTGSDPVTGRLHDDAAGQATQAARNVAAILAAAGCAPQDVVRLGLALVDLADLPVLNVALDAALDGHRCPRATVQVAALPGGSRLSIEALAVAGADSPGGPRAEDPA